MRNRILKFIILLAILFTGCNADLYTKHLALNHLKENPTITVVDGFMEFSYTENRGMIFGIMNQKESSLKNDILTGVNIISIMFLLFVIWRMRNLSFFYHLPFFIILSGALGNLIDRIRMGHVIDFIHIYFLDVIDWPYLFNVADVFITIGGILLVILVIFRGDKIEERIFRKTMAESN